MGDGSAAPAVVSFLSVILVLIPLPWHYRTKNIATLSLAFWLIQGNLWAGINAVIWMDNVVVRAKPYCNIATSFTVAGVLGMVAASMCTIRNLEKIASPRVGKRDVNSARNEMLFDVFMCLVLPFLFSAIRYIVAPNQFSIFEGIGCQATFFFSWPMLLLYNVPPLIFATTTLTYSILTIQWLQMRRSTIGKILRQSKASMTLLQFMRLMALAIFTTCMTFGFGIYQIYYIAPPSGPQPWVSWDNVHNHFFEIGIYPTVVLSKAEVSAMWGTWCVQPVAAFIFFALFGPTAQALNDFREAWRGVVKRVRGVVPGAAGGRPKGAETMNSINSRSMGTGSQSVGGNTQTRSAGPVKSVNAMSASKRYANGDDLDFDEGDDDDDCDTESASSGMVGDGKKPDDFLASATSAPGPTLLSPPSPSPSSPNPNPNRKSLVGPTEFAPRTPSPSRQVNFAPGPPTEIPLAPASPSYREATYQRRNVI